MSLTKYERDLLESGMEFLDRARKEARSSTNENLRHALDVASSYLGELVLKMDERSARRQDKSWSGRKRNPPLILLSNPPMPYKGSRSGHGNLKFLDLISEECHAILYRHIEDGKPYRHDFERPTQLVAVERNGKKDVLITSEDNAPIWQDF
jgi:hypothetical protein